MFPPHVHAHAMPRKPPKLEINKKALLRLTVGVGCLSGIELIIAVWLGMIPPDSSMEWTLVGVLVGGPILLTLVGVLSYFVLTRLGVDVPTDANIGGHDIDYIASRAKYGVRDDE